MSLDIKLQLPYWGGPKDHEEHIKFKQFLGGKTTHEELVRWLRAHRNAMYRLKLENAFNKLKKTHEKTLEKCQTLKNKVAELTKEIKELKELKGDPDEKDD